MNNSQNEGNSTDTLTETSFLVEVNRFVECIESMRITLPLMIGVISETNRKAKSDLQLFLVEKNISKEDGKFEKSYVISPEDQPRFSKLDKNVRSTELAIVLVPTSYLVALVSQYDAFLGRIIRIIFNVRPELLFSSERQMPYSDLFELNSLEEAKEQIINKEIESVLRKSHLEQIKWLEKKIDIPLTKDLKIWPTFIELTERRNLFVHADGVVSRHYLDVCREHGLEAAGQIENCTRLNVSLEYFEQACNCIFRMGVKLAHTLWRKLLPKELAKADSHLNDVCHNLILTENYTLAIPLLNFAKSQKKHHSERSRIYFRLNMAQSLKWNGEDEECNRELDSIDWSATGLYFTLGRLVLKEDYEEAARVMKKIGKNGEVTASDYKSLPIFQRFRKSDLFMVTYEEVFTEPPFQTTGELKRVEIASSVRALEYDKADHTRFLYDISTCFESGIRKCCIGNSQFPPIEIHKIQPDENILRFHVYFDVPDAKQNSIKCTIIFSAKLLSVENRILAISGTSALTKDCMCKDDPPYTSPIFEGVFDDGVIWNEIDKVLLALLERANLDCQGLEGEWQSPTWIHF